MISKNQIKYIKSLKSSKFRQIYNNFVAEGEKSVIEILKTKRFEIEKLFVDSSWLDNNKSLLTLLPSNYELINKKEMKSISFLTSPRSLFLIAKKSKNPFDIQLLKDCYTFYLDGVQDPGNVGTIIRIADWFGFRNVIRSEDSADFFNPKVVQSTMGSLGAINLFTLERDELIGHKAAFNLISMDMQGEDINSFDFKPSTLIVLGNEGKGVTQEIQRHVDSTIRIKGAAGRVAESLNVGVAAGIVASKI